MYLPNMLHIFFAGGDHVRVQALHEGALQAIFKAEEEHGEDPVVSRAFAEAGAGLCVASSHLSADDVSEGMICISHLSAFQTNQLV
jgi:hypothetical protein